MAEENGTYVNRDGRIQRYNQARSQPGMARPAWWIAGEVLAGPGPSASAPATAAEAFSLLGERWPVFAATSYEDIGYTGRMLDGAGARDRASNRAGVA
jgi:NADH-quinone oxidoreductase subunit G